MKNNEKFDPEFYKVFENAEASKENLKDWRTFTTEETTPEMALILRIVSQWGNAIEMPNMEGWLKDYAKQQAPTGARWVKASERLPGWDKLVEWRFAGKEPTAKETVRFLFSAANLDRWEWLDESAGEKEVNP